MTKMNLTVIAAFAATLACVPAAFAQQGQGQGQGRGQPGMGPVAEKCGEDIVRLCPGMEHGSRAIRDCLEAKKAQTSEQCRQALNSTGPNRN